MIVFNADTGGNGDLALMCWITQGYRSIGIDSAFACSTPSKKIVARMFGQQVVEPRDDAIPLGSKFPPYTDIELRIDRGKTPRARVWASGCPHNPPVVRPPLRLHPGMLEWGQRERREHGNGQPVVALLPFANYISRTWPFAYWLELGRLLLDRGVTPWYILESRRRNTIPKPFMRYWGYEWDQSTALALAADLVISNDSGPAHVYGTAGARTIALMGPTSNIFTHMDNVWEVAVSRETMPCTGCHFSVEGGWRDACRAACQSLMALTPATLLPFVLSKLEPAPVPEKIISTEVLRG